MASGYSDLSTRMSAENENRIINDIAFSHFKKYKVDISYAVETTFPFLEVLRDRDFITSEMYRNAQESFGRRVSLQEVIYDILSELEKKFDLSVLGVLFSKVIMRKYPELYRIYKIFKKVLPRIELLLGSHEEEYEERPNDQLSLEQGTGDNSNNCLIWLDPDASNYSGTAPPEHRLSELLREPESTNATETGATSDNNDALESQQANEQRAQASEPEGTMDLGNNSTSENAERRSKRKRPHTDWTNFGSEILPVTCRGMTGMLIKRKFERGTMVKCVRSRNGKWFTVREFQVEGGYSNATNWKYTVRCGGRPLQCLMEQQFLPKPTKHRRRTTQEDSKKCTVCLDEGKLFRCISCSSFFHGDCHLPPVERQRIRWKCTFCTIQTSTGSQECYSKSEVLARKMGPEEKLKCEFLLLKVYCHLERVVFPNIQPEKYVSKASQCLVKLRKLDKIKKKLIEGRYRQIKGFVGNVDNIFQNFNHYGSKEEFEKNFKEIFAIQ